MLLSSSLKLKEGGELFEECRMDLLPGFFFPLLEMSMSYPNVWRRVVLVTIGGATAALAWIGLV